MDTAQTVAAYIPKVKHEVGVPCNIGVRADVEVYRPDIQGVQPLALNKIDTKTGNKKLVDYLQKPFICVSTLFIAYMFTYSTLHVIALVFSH